MPEQIKNISVLMPAYNCSKYIGASIRSILNQAFREFEFIIIDDGSTDNTEEVVSSFKDTRIVYRKTENKGTAAALNLGLSLCSSEWVARIDADDLNTDSRLEKQIKFIEANPDYDVVSSWSVYFRGPSKILFLLREPVEHNDIIDYLDLHNPMNQSSIIYRKEKIKQAGYNEKFLSNEDFELFHRIKDNVRFYNIPEFLVYTRVRSDSKTLSMNNKNVYDFLFDTAFRNMLDAKSKADHYYWAGNIAWINYFFGEKKNARSYFKSSISFKNSIAYLSTFLPENYFNKFIDSRLRYRINTFMSGTKIYKQELEKLLGQK